MRSVLRTTAWCGALVATLAALVAAGDRLAPPPVHDPATLRSWIERTDPALTTFSLLRLAAIALVGYLLLTTVILVVAQVSRLPALIAASDRLTVPSVDRLIRHAVGAGLALTLAGGATAPLAASAAPRPDQHVVVGSGPGDPRPSDATGTTPPGSIPVLHALDDDLRLVHLGPATAASSAPTSGLSTSDLPTADPPAATDTASATAPSVERPPPAPMTTADAPPAAAAAAPAAGPRPTGPVADPGPDAEPVGGDHTIVSGDHLWGVAEHTLATAWGTPPEPAETAAYLQRLIEANRSVLAVADDPDLVFPGQVFALPPVTAR